MEILNWKQFILALLKPAGAVEALALGAMAIAAGVVGDAGVMALAALFDVSAQFRGAADLDGA